MKVSYSKSEIFSTRILIELNFLVRSFSFFVELKMLSNDRIYSGFSLICHNSF